MIVDKQYRLNLRILSSFITIFNFQFFTKKWHTLVLGVPVGITQEADRGRSPRRLFDLALSSPRRPGQARTSRGKHAK